MALLEPFQYAKMINRYKNKLQIKVTSHNQIWVLTNHGYDVTVISDTDQ